MFVPKAQRMTNFMADNADRFTPVSDRDFLSSPETSHTRIASLALVEVNVVISSSVLLEANASVLFVEVDGFADRVLPRD